MGTVDKKAPTTKATPAADSKALESCRHYSRESVAAALGLLFGDTRRAADLYADPLLLLVCDVLDGLSAALRAQDKKALGVGATWGRKQRKQGAQRLAKPVNLVRALNELAPTEELALRILRTGQVNWLGILTRDVQRAIDDATSAGKDRDLTIKGMLVAAGVPENTANNWIASAFYRDQK